ncbi:MAG TPA: SRPBCC family protein [Candidatus Limnocylindrales bacterium]|nr:SRPBCC family protein [Candidatus Limnocylindrales bacterium]
MAILRERIDTTLPLEPTFAFVADFANAEAWDPGVASSTRVDPGAVRVGSRYELGIRMAGRISPMEYVVTQFEPGKRVVLRGRGSGVEATDDISFQATPTGTSISYIADIQLRGLMRLLTPFARGAFERIAANARDGMQRALDERAAATEVPAAAAAPSSSSSSTSTASSLAG